MSKIKFTNIIDIPEEFQPQPASKFVPEWYKNLESYVGGNKKPNSNGTTTATAKRCMPLFDSITAGYVIVSPADVYIFQKDGQPYYEWSGFNMISFHPKSQAPEYPTRNGLEVYPKWNNPWGVKTPKGYSTLFVQPFHRESVFTIFSGIVDTDTYTAPVTFPFTLNNPKYEGLIPAGTPIAQVIPFKRESWKMEIGGEKELIELKKVMNRLQASFFDRYKSMFRSLKEYK